MFDNLEEVRYPWNSAVDFFLDGYAADAGSLHLVLGWLFVGWLILKTFRVRRQQLSSRFSVLYFALTVFNNPAYSFIGLNLNELFGVAAVLCVPWHAPLLGRGTSIVVRALLIVGAVSLIHGNLVSLIYPQLTSGLDIMFTKFAVNSKVFVLALNLFIVSRSIRRGIEPSLFILPTLWSGTAALMLYVVQGSLLVSGIVPFGTYLDAGFLGIPSFGSVSVERGHFGKFMAGYYPFFLFAFLAWGWRLRFILLVAVTLMNFSSSSQVFFLFFCCLTIWRFKDLFSFRKSIIAAPFVVLAVVALVTNFWDVFAGVIVKVYELAIQGDESTGGGRSFGTFFQYIKAYPLGLGYSGSTLRTAPDLPEINAAHFAFVTQYSVLALPIFVGYVLLVSSAVRRSKSGPMFLRTMGIGVMMSIIIFASDILWFMPLLWLPFVFIDMFGLARMRRAGKGRPLLAPVLLD